ncbi:MAG: DegV family protein [Anaerolineales bacterium]|jgi:DegV family protein with EDD domain
MKIAIVTDSTSDLTEEEARQHNIQVIPAILVMNGQQYLDGQGMSREDFYDQLPTQNPPPSTASPSSGMFTEVYRSLFAQGVEQIVSIHIASSLSGIVNAARVAAEHFSERVQVVDSGQLSMGLGYQALAAAKAALDGNLQQVHEAIESIQPRITLVAMLDTLEQLKRSGRVSWLQTSLGSILRIKLFVEVKKGSVLRIGESRTRKKGILRLSELLSELGPLEQLTIGHTNALQDATQLAELFAAQVSTTPLIRNVTTVIGTHIGVRGLGFIAVKAE